MGWEIPLSPQSAHFPASNYPQRDTVNNRPILAFDDTTDETAYWDITLPEDYAGGGLTVDIFYSHPATSGDVDADVAIERIGEAVLDVDSDSFAAVNVDDNNTVPATSGHVQKLTVTFTDGADMDSLAAGEMGRLSITFDSPGTAAGDIRLHRARIKETA